MFVLYVMDHTTVRLSNCLGLLILHVIIIGYLILEYKYWALFPGTVRIYINRYLVFMIYLLLNMNIKTLSEFISFCKWFAASIAVVYIGMYSFRGNNGSFLGSYQNVACAMCIAMLIVEIDMILSKEWEKVDICLFLLYLGVLMMTGKRTFLIIPFALLIVFSNIDNIAVSIKENRKRLIRLLLIISAIGVIVLIIKPEILSGINRLTDSNNGDALSGRDRLWALAIYLWNTSPELGIGMGGYVNFIRNNTLFTRNLLRVTLATSVHNIYLQLLAENGVIGFCIFVTYFIYNLVNAISNLIKAIRINDTDILRVAYFALFLQVWFLIYGITGNPLFTLFQLFIYFFSIMTSQSVRTQLREIEK